MNLRACAALLIALAMGSCDGPGQTLPQEPVVEEGECPNQRDAVSSIPAVQRLDGDIDGDGIDDRVTLHIDEGTRGCEAFVAVTTVRVVASEPVWEAGSDGGLPKARLNGVTEINGDPGLEIVVDEMSGASTQFAGAFALVADELERIEPEAADATWTGAREGVFPYGGSVGHIEGVDCAPEGGLVVSVARPAPSGKDSYAVIRRFFDVDGAALSLRDSERITAAAEEVFELAEFRAAPFGSCPNI